MKYTKIIKKIPMTIMSYFNSIDRVNFKTIIEQRTQNAGIWRGQKMFDISHIAKLSIVCFVVTNITQVVMLFTSKDPEKLFACFSVLSFCAMGFLKLTSLVVNHKRWRNLIVEAWFLETELLDSNRSEVDYESDDEGNHFSKPIESYTKNFSSISTNLARIYTFTAIVFMASPFLEFAIHLYQGIDIKELPHILPGWAPLDFDLFGYAVTIAAETVAAVYCVKVHLAFDLTAVGLMIFVRGQFSLLHAYSERIGGKGANCHLNKRKDDRAHFRIKKCHYIHVTLLKSVNQLGYLIQNILGIYFFVATLTLCSVAVQLKWTEHLSATELISLLQYMGATLTQLFLFCHYGDAVFNESSVMIGQGPFAAACWCLSPKIRREIALLCVGMYKPCRMKAGPFNSLDLPSFIQIIRAAYSYYAVLRNPTDSELSP